MRFSHRSPGGPAKSWCFRCGRGRGGRRAASWCVPASRSQHRRGSPPAWCCTNPTDGSAPPLRRCCARGGGSNCDPSVGHPFGPRTCGRAPCRFPSWDHMTIRDHLHIDQLWPRRPVVSVLRFDGVIIPRLQRGGVSLASHGAAIERAFRVSNLAAVAIVVNSPGGSAAQSALLFRRIREFADEKKVPVIAFAEDVAASGGYWLALAGDEIFTEETSLVGSIGVISAGFGFYQLLGRLGIERRLHTAGERKSLLDPFLPEDRADGNEPGTSRRHRRAARRDARAIRRQGQAARHFCRKAALAVLEPPAVRRPRTRFADCR